MSISGRPIQRVGTLDQSQQIQLLQQQVADLQRELALAQQNLETVLQMADAWATKLSSLHNTHFPTLRGVGAGPTARRFILQ